MFRHSRFEEASQFYQIAVRRKPKDGPAYVRLGLAQANAGNPVDAIASLRRALEVLPANDPRRIMIRQQLADISLAHMQNSETLDESEATARQLLSTNPKDHDGLRIAGAVMLARAEWLRTRDPVLYDRVIQMTLHDFESAEEARPGQPNVAMALARILSVMGRFSDAEARYRSLLEQNPRADAIRAEQYRLLLVDGKRSEARQVLLGAAGTASHPEWFLTMLVAQSWIDQDRPGMQAALDQLGRIARDQPRFCLMAGDFEVRAGDLEGALRRYNTCAARDTTSTNLRDERLISVMWASGKSGAAEPLARALLKRDPRNSVARTFQARTEIESGQSLLALRILDQVSTDDSANYEARLEEARAHLKEGEFEQARMSAAEALQRRPDFLPALLVTAQIQFKREEYRGAARTITQILAIDGANREARLMNAVLQEGIGSDTGVRSSNPRLAAVLAQIASGRFQDAASLFDSDREGRPQADRQVSAGIEPTQSGVDGRFVYLRKSEADDAVARNGELATKPDDPFVLARAVTGPWPAPERTTPKFTFRP
jgi:tetratricopeptide (TPR) repeat protein